MAANTEEVRIVPKWDNWDSGLMTALLVILFVAAVAVILVAGTLGLIVGGVLLIMVLAGGFVFFRGNPYVTMVLTPRGIVLRRLRGGTYVCTLEPEETMLFRTLGSTGGNGGFIPWGDIEKVGIFDCREKLVGIRLRSRHAYLKSLDLPPAKKDESSREGTSDDDPDDGFSATEMGLEVFGLGPVSWLIPLFQEDKTPIQTRLAANRHQFGYDLNFRYRDRDRSPEALAELLRSYLGRGT